MTTPPSARSCSSTSSRCASTRTAGPTSRSATSAGAGRPRSSSGPDGTEIVKLRGFYSPQFFVPVLVETVKDPSPVDYGTRGGPERARTLARSLTGGPAGRDPRLHRSVVRRRERGVGQVEAGRRADPHVGARPRRGRRSGDRGRRSGRPWSACPTWCTLAPARFHRSRSSPTGRRRRPSSDVRAEAALKAFAQAYALWRDPRCAAAGAKVARFLTGTMAAPDGGFYASLGLGEGNPGIDRRRLRARERAGHRRIAHLVRRDG